jgi:hypothetical protein
MAHQTTPSSQKALMMELKSLQEQPVEGFRITLVEESDLYNWEVAIFGPPNTLYEGGYFKVSQTRKNIDLNLHSVIWPMGYIQRYKSLWQCVFVIIGCFLHYAKVCLRKVSNMVCL